MPGELNLPHGEVNPYFIWGAVNLLGMPGDNQGIILNEWLVIAIAVQADGISQGPLELVRVRCY